MAYISTIIMIQRLSIRKPSLWQVKRLLSTSSEPSLGQNHLASDNIVSIIKNANAVCFDVDSTVIQDEGIDVLAGFKGAGEAVAAMTRQAMGGQILFQDALKSRLQIIAPSKEDISNCLKHHPPRLTPDIDKVVSKLHSRGVHVYLVSGGFRLMIYPVAEKLSIPTHRVFANTILFQPDGSYLGFDVDEPTSRDGGKPAVIRRLKDEHGYKTIVMIGTIDSSHKRGILVTVHLGDGATDMQARPPADAFIGFGGVVTRDVVKKGADWFITDFKDFLKILEA